MRVVIRAAPRARPSDTGQTAPALELLPGRQPSFLVSLTASVMLHAAALEITPGLLLRAEYWRFRPPEVEKIMAGVSRAAPLLVRVPETPSQEKLYFRPERRKLAQAGRRTPPPAARQAQAAPAESPSETQSPPSALVLQPGRSVEPPKKLPPLKALAVWSGPNPRQIEEPILPGAREPGIEPMPAGESVNLETPVPAPPKLPSSMAPAAAMERARVYLPPSGASPLSSRRQWLQEPDEPLSAANKGTLAALIILTPERAKPGETITVPPGNLVVVGNGSGQAAAAVPSPGEGKAAALAAAKPAPGSAGEAQMAKLDGRTGAVGSRGSGAANGTGTAETKRQDGTAASGAPGAPEEPAPGAAAAGARSAAAARTIRTATGDIFVLVEGDGSVALTYPAGGTFDVVVVDASLPQAIVSHTSALSGSPVYTAYLNVGQPVEWILHYCLPGGEAGARRQHSVVTLSAPKPLKAPYVMEAYLPPEPVWRWSGYQVFHGLLSAGGRLERLRTLQAGRAADVLMDSLRRWTFRPAMLDNAPAATEVLLVIPPLRQ